ncbi:MAG: hypothetical protein E7615_01245 [Ruminococcaceae bacterium]|nr:hypothetical protein [Oscillospiraceae bacterium]
MKIYSSILALLMAMLLIVFTACGGDGDEKSKNEAGTSAETVANSEGAAGSESDAEAVNSTPESTVAGTTEEESYETQTAGEDIADLYPDGFDESFSDEPNPDGSTEPDEVDTVPVEPSVTDPVETKPVPETTVPDTTSEHVYPSHTNVIELPLVSASWD